MAARYMDVLGQSFWLPDPDSVSQLAGQFGAVRDNLQETEQQLQALRSPAASADWTGQAAGTFAQHIGQLPGQLSQAHESYAIATAALSSYSAGLRPLISEILALATEADEAQSTLGIEQAELTHARQANDLASVTYWTSRLQATDEALSGYRSRLAYLLDELESLSGLCTQQIARAQRQGIHNDLFTDFERYVVMDGGTALHDIKSVTVTVGSDLLVKPFTDFKRALAEYRKDRSLKNLGALLGALGGILGLAALLVPGLGEFVAPIALAALAADVAAAYKHEGVGWQQITEAALGFGLAGLGHVLDQGVEADDGLLRGALGDRFGGVQEFGELARGDDARVTAKALLISGVKRTFSLDGLKSPWVNSWDELSHPVATLRDDGYALTHKGVSPQIWSPVAVRFQQINFFSDRGQDIAQVHKAQVEGTAN